MSTIHNPKNFKPEDYKVVGYFDNQPPRYYGGPIEMHNEFLRQWRRAIEVHFPEWPKNAPSIHRCVHCGNTQIRYVSVCLHKPTGEKVIFGDICEGRLGFESHDGFAARHIRTRAMLEAKKFAFYEKKQKFLAAHPDFAKALEALKGGGNSFTQDIAMKFDQYGSLSDAQVAAFLKSIARDQEFAARREAEKAAAGPVPTGKRIEFEGVMVSWKVVVGQFGQQTKMLVRLDNGSKVWMTMPTAYDVQTYGKGSRVKMRATVTVSKDDSTFGFGSRPTLLSVTAQEGAIAA